MRERKWEPWWLGECARALAGGPCARARPDFRLGGAKGGV
jgi:hypothetical protein